MTGGQTCRVHFDAQWISELPADVDLRPGDVLGFRAERKAAFAEDEKRARKAGSPVTAEKCAELRRKMEEEEEEPGA